MYIKIIKGQKGAWYSNKIGEIYEVDPVNIIAWDKSIIEKFFVRLNSFDYIFNYVEKDDCEVLPELKPKNRYQILKEQTWK